MRRRRFLQVLAAAGCAPCWSCRPGERESWPTLPGRIVNPAPIAAHLLRADMGPERFPPPAEPPFDVVVAGAGVSGLAAAWKLRRAGVERLLVLEAGAQVGGTCRSGARRGAPFPWGAHYIHIPPAEADCVHEVLLDLGVITGYDARGWPQVEEGALLRWPHERLFVDGQWHQGLDPTLLAGAREREEGLRFRDAMLRWALCEGRDGRRAFVLPTAYSSRDGAVRALDRTSMAHYLREQGFAAPSLRWLVDYACRDDYGSLASQVSAWAGIHYYACRCYDYRLHDTYPAHTLTWPEGNARLVRGLAARLEAGQVRTGQLVLRVEERGGGVQLGCYNLDEGRFYSLRSRALVYAGKLHAAPFVVPHLPPRQRRACRALQYSPWLVAAIHLKAGRGGELRTWDNALYDSPSLGYVVADHQTGAAAAAGRTLVYYLPFVEDIAAARRHLLEREHAFWVRFILRDLAAAHPHMAEDIERIDIYRWGHAMLRPAPGSVWGEEARWRRRPCGHTFFAACDSAALPLFEEALFAGLYAAESAMAEIGVGFETSLGRLGDEWG